MPEEITDDQAQNLLDDAIDADSDTDAGDDKVDDSKVKDWKSEASKWQAMARKHEQRAKENAAAKAELEKLRKASMTEQEKAVAEAEERGKSTALKTSAVRLARAEFRATAAGRVDQSALDGFLEYADLSKFVGENGEPDEKAIEAAVKKLAGSQRAPSFDGGVRRTAGRVTDMNSLIRQHAGLG